MAVVKPFSATHYNQDKFKDLALVVAPPYDVISDSDLAKMKGESPYNFSHIILPQGVGGIGSTDQEKFLKTAEIFKRWQRENIFVRDSKPSLYFYKQSFSLTASELFCQNTSGPLTRVGMFCLVGLEEYSSKIILPHEKTFAGPKADRYLLMDALQGNMEPVFLGYDSPRFSGEEFSKITLGLKPNFVFKDSSLVTHEIWTISDSKVLNEVEVALKAQKFFILDGHHRYETALKYYLDHQKHDANLSHRYVMATICSFKQPGTIILPTHRGLKNGDVEAAKKLLLQKGWSWTGVSSLSELERELKGTENPCYGVKLKDSNKFGVLKASTKDSRLDLEILHQDVLPLFSSQPALEYIKDILELETKVDRGDLTCGFLVRPSTSSEVIAIAEKNAVMPHKSTFFYPKIPSGLVVNTFD